MPETDYYHILGLGAEASHSDIRRAYRILAMRFHPDQNPNDPAAEERFKLITQAYKVLIDPKQRLNYDRARGTGRTARPFATGTDTAGTGNPGNPPPGPAPKAKPEPPPRKRPWWEEIIEEEKVNTGPKGEDLDIRVDMTIDPETALYGGRQTLAVTVDRPCEVCDGTGAKPGTPVRKCPECDPSEPDPHCRLCAGRGTLVQAFCPSCHGKGGERRKRTLEVIVPVRAKNGQEIRVEGKGVRGRNGKAGDLIIRLHIKGGARMEQRGGSVYSEVQITPSMAAQGGRVRVKTLESWVDLNIPPGTRSDTVFRLEGMGPRTKDNDRGDHFVTVKIIST